jgi:hypothetical protein
MLLNYQQVKIHIRYYRIEYLNFFIMILLLFIK